MKTKLSKKVKDQLSWFEVVLSNNKVVHIMATSLKNASDLANDLLGENEWDCVTNI